MSTLLNEFQNLVPQFDVDCTLCPILKYDMSNTLFSSKETNQKEKNNVKKDKK